MTVEELAQRLELRVAVGGGGAFPRGGGRLLRRLAQLGDVPRAEWRRVVHRNGQCQFHCRGDACGRGLHRVVRGCAAR